MTLQKQSEGRTHETVAARIMRLISETGLKPGERLPTERELSQALGASRYTIFQAIKTLTVSGILQSRQGSGVYVARTTPTTTSALMDVTVQGDPNQVQQLCEFRTMLETCAVRLATERITLRGLRRIEEAALATQTSAEVQDSAKFVEADMAVHLGIAEATGNDYLISSIAAVNQLQIWANGIAMGGKKGTPGSQVVAAEQHLAIVQAIHDGDAEAAATRMRDHIQTFLENYQLEVRQRMSTNGS